LRGVLAVRMVGIEGSDRESCIIIAHPTPLVIIIHSHTPFLPPSPPPSHHQPQLQLIKDGFVIKKPEVVHSRSRFLARLEAKRKGRHTGMQTLTEEGGREGRGGKGVCL